MKIIDKLNMFVKNMTGANNKKEDSVSSPLNICDMPVQQEEFTTIKERDELIIDSPQIETEKSEDVLEVLSQSVEPKTEEDSAEEEQKSLLDNSEYMALAQQCCDMLSELDRMQNQIKNEEVFEFISMQKSRIREALMLSGATLIDEETEFNMLRHQSVEGGIVKNGTLISEFVEAGVEIDGRVMVKGKVIPIYTSKEGVPNSKLDAPS